MVVWWYGGIYRDATTFHFVCSELLYYAFFLDLVAWWHTTMPPVPLDRISAEKSGIRAVNGPNSGIVHDDPDDARRLSSATCATRAAS